MPPDATDTKRRILAAARAEFAAYGLAGARVDRIADAASANKRSIYVHFGPKEELFDVVIAQSIAELEERVPFAANGLEEYAGALFDFLVSDPSFGRLAVWAQLERTESGASEIDAYARKIGQVTATGDRKAVDTLVLVLGLVTSWFLAAPGLRAQAHGDPWGAKQLAKRRAEMTAAVAAILAR